MLHLQILPKSYVVPKTDISKFEDKDLVVISIRVLSKVKINKGFKASCKEVKSGKLIYIYVFNKNANYINYLLKIDSIFTVYGKFSVQYNGITNPYLTKDNYSPIQPEYSSVGKLPQYKIQQQVKESLSKNKKNIEWIDEKIMKKNNWLNWNTSIERLHFPKEKNDIAVDGIVRRRLAYDELLAIQLALEMRKKMSASFRSISFTGELKNNLLNSLGFELTGDQKQAISDIELDQKNKKSMIRLLHGEVGSGKTIVALSSIANAVEANTQAVFMSPTKVLAYQHFLYTDGLKIAETVYIDDSVKGKARKKILEQIKSGEAKIIIGTHAVFQDLVEFNDLSLVVIDEQHRFGVNQRSKLIKKGQNADILLMSATPIPRTLMLAINGGIECSAINIMPKGRIPTETTSSTEIDEVIHQIRGKKSYWVCPLIEKSSNFNATPIAERYEYLKEKLGESVDFIHGKMSNKEVFEKLQNFKENKGCRILVSTTVIEVGIDIRDVNCIVIENSELFGLTQIHQLRGRIGRGDEESLCILLHKKNIGKDSYQRIKILSESNDGFYIAKKDLEIRGPGKTLGIEQSGNHDFKFADIYEHEDLLEDARLQAKKEVEKENLDNKFIDLLNTFSLNDSLSCYT